MLDNRKCILFVRGERPMLDDKYDLMHHPNMSGRCRHRTGLHHLFGDGGCPARRGS